MRTYCTSFSKRIFFSIVEQVKLLFVGDVSFSVPLKYYVEHGYHTYNDSFNEVAKYVKNADFSVANLESPFVSKDMYRYKLKGKSVVLDASSDAASALRWNILCEAVSQHKFKKALRTFNFKHIHNSKISFFLIKD